MISENFFRLPDSEMRLWALISTLNFQTPGWDKEPLRCCFMKRIIFFYWRRWRRRWWRRWWVPASCVSKPAVESSLSVFVAGWRTRENLLLRSPLLLSKEGGILHATAPPSGWSLRWVWRWRTRPSLLLLFGGAEEKDTLQVHSVYLLKNYSKFEYLLLIQVFTVAVSWFRKAFHFIF